MTCASLNIFGKNSLFIFKYSNKSLQANIFPLFNIYGSDYLCKIIVHILRRYNNRSYSSTSVNGELKVEFAKKEGRHNSQILLRALAARGKDKTGNTFVCSSEGNYLFNCGDGLPRICHEYDSISSKERKLFGVFITSNKWENVSGITNLQQSMQADDPDTKLNIFCPQGLKDSLMAVLKETISKNGKASFFHAPDFFEISKEDDIFDKSLSIKSIPIVLSQNKKKSSPSKYMENFNYVLAYVCRASNNMEKVISLEKLLKHDVPPGPLINELRKGSVVVLPNGSVVRPEDVTNVYGDQGKCFIVLEIPSKDFLDPLILCKSFAPYQKGNCSKEEDYPQVIVHLSPEEVINDERYLKWMNSFSDSVFHMFVNNQIGAIDLEKYQAFQQRLHHFIPSIFPLPFIEKESLCTASSITYKFQGNAIRARTGLSLALRPSVHYTSTNCSGDCSQDLIDFQDSGIADLKKKLIAIEDLEVTCNRPNKDYPHIHFLGTVSSRATAYRNESSILIHVDKDSCLLLDCGPGTLNQLFRQYGSEGTYDVLHKLKLIYISHYHSDHFAGLNTLVKEVDKLHKSNNIKVPTVPLLIMAEPRIFKYLNTLQYFMPLNFDIKFLDNSTFLYKSTKIVDATKMLNYLGFHNIKTTFVPHCYRSYGVAFTHRNGWKLVYSGDTMPSEELIQIGRGCDILIHEATFQDSLHKDAAYKRHCTVSQAIDVAKRMEAKNVILTHFSPRYHKIPVIEKNLPGNVCIAFDNMMVTKEDIPFLSHLYPILKELYKDEYNNLMGHIQNREDRKARKSLKERRKNEVFRDT